MTLTMILATLTALGVLITIHEFGHFYVARRCGVKVLTFSIGFGPTLFKHRGKDGVDYQLAALPLGGYVRMLDSREGQVSDAEKHLAFDQQSLKVRSAIVAAGPAINLIFAAAVYAVLAMVGTQYAAPILGQVAPDSAAERAGLPQGHEFISIAGRETDGWQAVGLAIVAAAGESEPLEVRMARPGDSTSRVYRLDVSGLDGELNDPLGQLGIEPYAPPIDPIVGGLSETGPAKAAGMQQGDRIVSIDGQAISGWMELVDAVRASDGRALAFGIDRPGQRLELSIAPVEMDGALRVGILPRQPDLPPEFIRTQQSGPVQAVFDGIQRTAQMSVLTLEAMWKMLTGVLSTANLSGPITIAKVATASAESGLLPYLAFVAYLSVSLGVLNLLPIPVLDGGHLTWYAVEAIRGKPVSERIQAIGVQLGMSLVMALMVVAFYNDLFRP